MLIVVYLIVFELYSFILLIVRCSMVCCSIVYLALRTRMPIVERIEIRNDRGGRVMKLKHRRRRRTILELSCAQDIRSRSDSVTIAMKLTCAIRHQADSTVFLTKTRVFKL